MAIAVDSTASGGFGASPLTWSHTCTGSNLLLTVVCFGSVGIDDVTGVTYNGVSMTLATKVQMLSAQRWIYLFYLLGPATGANTIQINGSAQTGGVSASYTGVKQSGQPDATTSNTYGGTSVTTTLTTVSDNCWTIAGSIYGGPTITAGANTTLRKMWATLANVAILDSNGAITPAGSTSLISNSGITNGAQVMASFAPALPAPVADFTGTPTSGTTPLSVAFTDASTNTPTSWLWERTSDGTNWTSFSTSQNPSQSFTTGTWGVRLTATNAGGSNTKTSLAYITVTAPAGGTPTIISFATRGVDWSEVERIKLEKALARKKVELKKVAKKIKAAEKRVEVSDPPRGILANLHLLEQKEAKLQIEIAEMAINLESMVDFLSKLEFEDDDEDDDWLHLI